MIFQTCEHSIAEKVQPDLAEFPSLLEETLWKPQEHFLKQARQADQHRPLYSRSRSVLVSKTGF